MPPEQHQEWSPGASLKSLENHFKAIVNPIYNHFFQPQGGTLGGPMMETLNSNSEIMGVQTASSAQCAHQSLKHVGGAGIYGCSLSEEDRSIAMATSGNSTYTKPELSQSKHKAGNSSE